MPSVPYSRFIIGSLPWYSFLIVSGAVLAITIAMREEKRIGLKKDTVLDLALILLPSGILGARLYYVAFSWSSFRDNPVSVLYIWEGGLAIYGGVLAGLLAAFLFCRFRKISFGTVCDLLAPGLALAQAVGRWGNYFNMEAYGSAVTDPSLCFFPLCVFIPADGGWHLATFFYESVWDLCIFIFLLFARRRSVRKAGDLFLFYLFLYAAGRFTMENFRMDSLYAVSSVRVSQLLSELVCVCLTLYFLFFRRDTASRHSVRGVSARILCVCALALLTGLILFATRLVRPDPLPLAAQFASLAGTALFSVVAFLMLYGRTGPEEVLYANHRA